MRNNLRLSTSICALLVAGLPPSGAHAQADTQTAAAQTASSEASAFEEIVVTARKREEKIQVVPIAITAFSANDLETKNVQSLADLRLVTPSVSVQTDTFRQDTINITIRGLRNFPGSGIQYDTAAAVYVNGVYYARTQGLTGALFDVSNVQVLKGPQGTLVGRNATGGAVLYSTREPEDVFGASAQATGGDYGRKELQGTVNIPITDKIAIRTSYSYSETAGYLRNEYYNPATGERNDTPGLGSRKTAMLFALKFTPDDESKILLRGDFDAEHHTGASYHLLNYFEGSNPSTGNVGSNPAPVARPSICQIPTTCGQLIDLNGRTIDPYFSNVATRTVNTSPAAYNSLLNVLARHKTDFYLVDQANSNYNVGNFQSVSGSYDRRFGEVDFKLVAGYRWYATATQSDSRGAPYDTLDTSTSDPSYKAYTADATLNGKAFDSNLSWTTGLFFFNEDSGPSNSTSYLFSTNQLTPQPIAGRQVTGSDGSVSTGENTSYAGYAQATYKILPELRLTGGVRYSIDKRKSSTTQTAIRFPATAATAAAVAGAIFVPGPFVLNGIAYSGLSRNCGLTDINGAPLPVNGCTRSASETFKEPTWTVSLDYDIWDKSLVYFTARKGYKSGALNASATNPALLSVKPEKVQDYEAGIKSDWMLGDIPFRTNFAAYLTDYSDVQTQVSLPSILTATGPGGIGACTQALFNAGQCLGTQTSPITMNARSAQLYGGEWDISVKPVPEWTISWNGSYLHTVYKEFTFTVPAGYLQPASGADLTGKAFQLPGWGMSGSTTYALTGEQLSLPVEDVSLTYNIYYQSNFRTDLTGYNALQKIKGYALSNVRLGVQNIAETNISLSATVSNLMDRKVCTGEPGGTSGGSGVYGSTPNSTFGVVGSSGIVQCIPLPPRMFAVTAKWVF